jgi:hypothetical protein
MVSVQSRGILSNNLPSQYVWDCGEVNGRQFDVLGVGTQQATSRWYV